MPGKYIFVGAMLSLVLNLKNKRSKNNHRKIYPVDLDSPRRELVIRGLGFIVAPLVRWQIDFFCRLVLDVQSSCNRIHNIMNV